MKYNRTDILHQAAKSGWVADVHEKAIRLLLFLELIQKHPFLQGKLLLKGGTALNLFYLETPRLSVDIDANFIGSVDVKDLQVQRPEIERAVTAIANSEDYSVSYSADTHAGRKLYLQYTNISGARDRIEIDINYMFRIPLSEPEKISSKYLSGFNITFPLVGWNELMAGKLLAAIDRVAPRDIYDLAKAYARINLNDSLFRATCIGLSAILPHPLYTYDLKRFDKADKKSMEIKLLPFLREDTNIDYDNIRSKAASLLSWLLGLNKRERQYISEIAKGQVKPELLLPEDQAFCNSLKQHPAVLWKIQNVRKHIDGHEK